MMLICLSFYRDTCLSCEDGGVNICGLGDHLSGLGVRPQCSLHICSVSLPCFLKQMVLICEILINFKNMLVRNENKNIKWQGRSCHVHRDCNRYHTSPWTNHHSCEGGSYKYSKAWNDFWISHNFFRSWCRNVEMTTTGSNDLSNIWWWSLPTPSPSCTCKTSMISV